MTASPERATSARTCADGPNSDRVNISSVATTSFERRSYSASSLMSARISGTSASDAGSMRNDMDIGSGATLTRQYSFMYEQLDLGGVLAPVETAAYDTSAIRS